MEKGIFPAVFFTQKSHPYLQKAKI